MKRLLLLCAFLAFLAVPAFAQEGSEISGGGSGGGGGIGGSGTAGAIPKFASTTTLGDSKLVTSGTNNGTLTLYDDTAVTGVSRLIVRAGAGQSTTADMQVWANDGTTSLFSVASAITTIGRGLADYELYIGSDGGGVNPALHIGIFGGIPVIYNDSATIPIRMGTGSGGAVQLQTGTGYNVELKHAAGQQVTIGDLSVGIAQVSAGVLKVTDGSSGNGALLAGNLYAGPWPTDASYAALYHQTAGASNYVFIQDSSGNTFFNGASLSFRIGAGAVFSMDNASFYPSADGAANFGNSTHAALNTFTKGIQGWQTKTLTESAATGFVDIPLAQNTVIGGYVEYVVRTTNGTDYSVESGQLFFTGASKTNGTVDDADVGLVGTPVQSTTAANTFTNQFTVTKGTNKITLNCQSDSTLTSPDTITLFYRVHLNGAQTETITGL